MNKIKLELAIDDLNLILEALGNLPFARVYNLVGKIQEQAGGQLEAGVARDTPEATGNGLSASE